MIDRELKRKNRKLQKKNKENNNKKRSVLKPKN